MRAPLLSIARLCARGPRGLGAAMALCVAFGLATASDEAAAAALGGVQSAIGLLGALIAMLMLKAWPGHPAGGALSALTGVAVVVAGAAWWRRPSPATRALIPLPAGVSRARLLGDLRDLFFAVHAAWDRGDMQSLQSLTLPSMLDELCALRPVAAGAADAHTEVVSLRAELLGFEALSECDLVSIDFSGWMRDSPGKPAAPFREVWMLTRDREGACRWRLARHQALL